MRIYLALLLATSVALESRASFKKVWSYEELNEKAMLIVIATPTKVTAISERQALASETIYFDDGTRETAMGDGVETTFEVLTVLKGERSTKTFVLHHFKLGEPLPMLGLPHPKKAHESAIGFGPLLISFEPKNKKQYMMFLEREPDGRYVAASGQTDPALAIKVLDGLPEP